MQEDIVNLAEEFRSCTRYGENSKYIIPKNSTKHHAAGPRIPIKLSVSDRR